jgi:hypothetical protein
MVYAEAERVAMSGITFEDVRQIALAFPGLTEETTSGRPVFKLKHCLMVGEADHEPAGILALKVGMREAEFLIEAEPEIYYLTKLHRSRCNVLIRMSEISPKAFQYAFEKAWRRLASKRDVKAYDEGKKVNS